MTDSEPTHILDVPLEAVSELLAVLREHDAPQPPAPPRDPGYTTVTRG